MSRGVADTSLFIARESGRPFDVTALADELSVSIITIGELRAGVLAADTVEARDRRLATLTSAQQLEPVPIDESVAAEWARLRVLLRDSGQRMPINDSWIAATAMSLQVPVITQDHDLPDLRVLDVVRV